MTASNNDILLPMVTDRTGTKVSNDRDGSLTESVINGVGWVFVGKIAGRLLTVTKLVVLARLLAPDDFGLFGIVMLAMAAMEAFAATGFERALIQRQDDARAYLDLAWTVQLVRGALLAGCLYAGAPLVAWLFNEPRAASVLRVLCLVKVGFGTCNIGIVYWQKNIEFHKRVVYDFMVALVSAIVGIGAGWMWRNIWSLVWANLAGALTASILSYIMHPYRPRLKFSASRFWELFVFGKWMLGASVVLFVANNGADAALGRMLGAATLGAFQIAHRFADIVATEITHTTSVVLFPAYAKVQDNRDRLRRGFCMTMDIVLSFILPLTVFLVMAAPEIVVVVLGAQWITAIVPMRILALSGFLRAVNALGGPLFMGMGRPQMEFYMNLSRAVTLAAVIYPLTRWWGIEGASWGLVIALSAALPVWYRGIAYAGINVRDVATASISGILLCILTVAGCVIGRAVAGASPSIALGTMLVAALVFGIIGGWMLWRIGGRGPARLLVRILSASRDRRKRHREKSISSVQLSDNDLSLRL